MAPRDSSRRGEARPHSETETLVGTFLAVLFWAIGGVLESLFAQRSEDSGSGGTHEGTGSNRSESNGGQSGRAQKAEHELQEAFRFFDFSLSEVQSSPSSELEEIRSKLKKKWRKMSLAHHPDRNNNSEESILLSQQLNHCYDLVCHKLDQLEGIADDHSDEDESFDGTSDAGEGSDEEEEEGESVADLFRKQMKDLERERARVQADIRRGQKSKKWQARDNRGKRRKRKQSQPVPDSNSSDAYSFFGVVAPHISEVATNKSGRDGAHDAWVEATAKYVAYRREDGVEVPERPKHLLFESSTNDIALAIRLGKIEAVSLLIRSKVMHHQWLHGGQDEQETCLEVLELPIDEDGNTILHYAAYYESSETVSLIMMMVGPYFPDIVLKENYRHQQAVELCIASTNDGFKERMELITQSAHEAFDKNLDEQRIWSRLKKINLLGSLYSLLAFALVGRIVFGCGNVASFAICLFHSHFMNSHHTGDSTNFLFMLHFCWKVLLLAFALLKMQPISLYLMLPTGLLLCWVFRDVAAKIAILGVGRMNLIIRRSLEESAKILRLSVAIPRVAGNNEFLAGCLYLLSYGLIALACKWPFIYLYIFCLTKASNGLEWFSRWLHMGSTAIPVLVDSHVSPNQVISTGTVLPGMAVLSSSRSDLQKRMDMFQAFQDADGIDPDE